METFKELIQVLSNLYTTSGGGGFHMLVIMVFVVGIMALFVIPFTVISLLTSLRYLILGIAYKLSPGMQQADAEVEKIEAERHGPIWPFLKKNLSSKKPEPKSAPPANEG